MDYLLIDNEKIDPYFILDCVPEDSVSNITKSFRRKAKIWHPDKLKSGDKDQIKLYEQRFKILTISYEYIMNKKKGGINSGSYKQDVTIPKNTSLPVKNIDNTDELRQFNQEFVKNNALKPNDFGYNAKRMENLKEYDEFNYKPSQLFSADAFNPVEFNKTFEYNQEKQGMSSTNEVGVYHKTNDGFDAYNGSDLNGIANVSSYNGIMIVGDSFGETGVGYYDSNFSDYKQSFMSPKNPDVNLNVPSNFKSSPAVDKPINKKQFQQQINLQLNHRSVGSGSGGASKQNFALQEQKFLEQQQINLKQKIEDDKNFISQFKNLYQPQVIEDAFSGNLITNADYCDITNINKHFTK